MIFGTNALITKPAVSLAPMITVYVFNRYGYDRLSDTSASPGGPSTLVDADLDNTMFQFLVWTPLVLAVLQLLFWSGYTLRDSHYNTQIKSEMQISS